MNIITIELCQEDRARLDKIIEALEQTQQMPAAAPVEQNTPRTEAGTESIPETEVSTAVQEDAEKSAEAFNEETAPEPVEEPAKVVSLADIQKKVVELSAAGKKAEVRDIITKYANRVSAIPAEYTAEVWNQLTVLEG